MLLNIFQYYRKVQNSMYKSSHRSITNYYTIQKNKILGSGSTGIVYRGFDIHTKKPVAIKVLDLEKIDNEVSKYLLRMEQNALLGIQHPNVLKGIDIFYEKYFMYLVTEYCNEGTLKDIIRKQGFLQQSQALKLFQGIVKGLITCNKKNILHRDLKPANIMLNDGIPKIIDFGYCEIGGFKKPTLEYNVGSPSYMAPECYKLNMYNQKTEVWALGVTLYQLVTGKTLDQGRDMNDCFRQLIQLGVSYPDQLSYQIKQLIGWCLEYDPKRRPTLQQLLRQLQKRDRVKPSYSFLSKATSSTNILKQDTSTNSLYFSPLSSKTALFSKYTQRPNTNYAFKSIKQKCKIEAWNDRENLEQFAIQDSYLGQYGRSVRQRYVSKLSDENFVKYQDKKKKLYQGLRRSKKVENTLYNIEKTNLSRQASMTFR